MRVLLLIVTSILFAPELRAQDDGTNYIGRRAEHRQKMMFGMHGGWSAMLPGANMDPHPDPNDQVSIRSGFHINVEAAWFSKRNVGIGGKFNRMDMTGDREVVTIAPVTGARTVLNARDDISVNFIAPTLYARLYSGSEKIIFLFDLSVGWLGYRNNRMMPDLARLTGSTTGIMYGLRMDHMINERFSAGIGFSHLLAGLRQITVDDGQMQQVLILHPEERENLTRIDISIGLRWHW